MNYYDLLQVSEKAEKKEIISAYRLLVKKYHPDINKSPGAERKMIEINGAYSTLSNPVSRFYYDQKLQTERNANKNSTVSYSSTTYQPPNTEIKKEPARSQQPPPKQKREPTSPPYTPPQTETDWSKIFSNINNSMKHPKYIKLGIFSSLKDDGELEIVDVGKLSFFNYLRFSIFLAIFSASTMSGLFYFLSDYNRFLEILKVEPLTVFGYSVVALIIGWSAYILRPRNYRLIFRKNNFTIILHKTFKRTIEYKRIFYSKTIIDDPSYLKIYLKNGRKIRTLRNAPIMEVANEIIGVMVKNNY